MWLVLLIWCSLKDLLFQRLVFISQPRILYNAYLQKVIPSLIELLLLDFEHNVHCLFESVYHHRGWVLGVVFGTLVHPRLSQKGTPLHLVGSLNIGPRVVSHHEEAPVSILFHHHVLHVLKNCLDRFSEVVLIEIELVFFAVIFKHVVERAKSHSRSVVPSGKGNIVVASKVGRKRLPSDFPLVKHVVNDFQGLFIGIYIIEGENGLNLSSPFVIIIRQSGSSQSLLDPLLNLGQVLLLCVKGQRRVFFEMLVRAMEDGMQLICNDIVADPHFVDDILNLQGSRQKQDSALAAEFAKMRADGTMTHEHQFGVVKLLVESLVHLLVLYSFEITSSVGEEGQGNSCLPQSDNSVSGSVDGGGPPHKNSINVSDKEGLELALLLDNLSDVCYYFLHLKDIIQEGQKRRIKLCRGSSIETGSVFLKQGGRCRCCWVCSACSSCESYSYRVRLGGYICFGTGSRVGGWATAL